MSLTVSELLALEGLSALRLRAESRGCSGPYAGTMAENEHIAEWIMGGELVFITGISSIPDEANPDPVADGGQTARHRRDGDHRQATSTPFPPR